MKHRTIAVDLAKSVFEIFPSSLVGWRRRIAWVELGC